MNSEKEGIGLSPTFNTQDKRQMLVHSPTGSIKGADLNLKDEVETPQLGRMESADAYTFALTHKVSTGTESDLIDEKSTPGSVQKYLAKRDVKVQNF